RIVWPATLNETGVRYGDLRIAWNAVGIGFQVDVNNKRSQPRCYPSMPETSDGLQVWIDTRNTQTIHRASRYCHSFCFLPLGAGPKGLQPHATAVAIARAREEAAVAAPTGKPVV